MEIGTRTVLFRNGTPYRRVRIPALVQSNDGTLTVLVVGRHRVSDWGRSDVLGRRSTDGGLTWSPVETILRGGRHTVDNPTLVAEPGTARVHLVYQIDYRRLMHRVSWDGAATFEPATDITAVLDTLRSRDGYRARVVAPGPGAGAVLPSGRLVMPLWVSSARRQHRPSATLTIVSDDHGMTWQAGEFVAPPGEVLRDPSEAAVAVTGSGGVVMSVRHESSKMRAISRSADGATGWSTPELVPELFDPVCHASLAAIGNTLYFANPDSRANDPLPRRDRKHPRRNLTLRTSPDDGVTWESAVVAEPGASAYSALIADRSGTALHLVYEGGAIQDDPLGNAWIGYRRIDLR